MEYIKRKRCLENYTIRHIPENAITFSGSTPIINKNVYPWYGTIPPYKIDKNGEFILVNGNKVENTINIDIFLRQNLDDMGLFTDKTFTPLAAAPNQSLMGIPSAYTYTNNVLTYPSSVTSAYTNFGIDGRIAGATLNFYITPLSPVTGTTNDTPLKSVSSLRVSDLYVLGLNVAPDPTTTFTGVIDLNNTSNPTIITYVLGGDVDNSGLQPPPATTWVPDTGVKFITTLDEFVKGKNSIGEDINWYKTEFKTQEGGWNPTNISLSAIMKQEEFLGVVFKPEVSSDVFINRGIADIFERHALLSELKTTDDIDNSRGGWLTVE
tara:strand:+ start:1493 stop:2461 length:969 start_codon:yes stop_codon:yes gene_type:complete